MTDTTQLDRTSHAAGWPRTRRSRWIASLAAASMLVAVAACSGDDDAADPDTDADVAGEPGTEELDEALERADAAEAERDELAAELEAQAAVAEELAAAEEQLTTTQDELALAQVQLDSATQRAEAAEARVAEVEDIAGQFPISLDSSLIPDDMPGTYRIDFQEAYCDGFSDCGTQRAPTNATVYFTSDQFLRVGVEGILDAGLFALDGSLYGITDSLTALPPCGENQRRARITVTMYAGSISVLEDGTRVVNDLNASITIDAPADGPDCPSGLVFYASSLIPVT